ncbi:MAG: hypothetical protein V4751_11590 [Pseudomonadota bacterium]
MNNETGAASHNGPIPHHHSTPGKLDRMLSTFAKGEKLNTFAAKELGDTCLHTTVSDLQQRHGVRFTREWQTVEGRFGKTRVRVYWLQGEDLQRACQIVAARRASA